MIAVVSSIAARAIGALKSSNGGVAAHVHHFVDDDDCRCGITFDEALKSTAPLLLEVNPCS